MARQEVYNPDKKILMTHPHGMPSMVPAYRVDALKARGFTMGYTAPKKVKSEEPVK